MATILVAPAFQPANSDEPASLQSQASAPKLAPASPVEDTVTLSNGAAQPTSAEEAGLFQVNATAFSAFTAAAQAAAPAGGAATGALTAATNAVTSGGTNGAAGDTREATLRIEVPQGNTAQPADGPPFASTGVATTSTLVYPPPVLGGGPIAATAAPAANATATVATANAAATATAANAANANNGAQPAADPPPFAATGVATTSTLVYPPPVLGDGPVAANAAAPRNPGGGTAANATAQASAPAANAAAATAQAANTTQASATSSQVQNLLLQFTEYLQQLGLTPAAQNQMLDAAQILNNLNPPAFQQALVALRAQAATLASQANNAPAPAANTNAAAVAQAGQGANAQPATAEASALQAGATGGRATE